MIHHHAEQGSGEWLKLRAGIPTASNFHRIITPAKGQLSKQARGYAFRLLAERMLNELSTPLEGMEWMERGKELEPQAIQMYEFEQDVVTLPCGLLTTNDGKIGATPDRLIKDVDGAVELKCPSPWVHLEYMLDGFGADYVPQVQGQILVGEFDFVDRYSHHPQMPPVLQRTNRDDAYQKLLHNALTEFCDMLDEMVERANRMGLFAERARLLLPVDAAVEELTRPSHTRSPRAADATTMFPEKP